MGTDFLVWFWIFFLILVFGMIAITLWSQKFNRGVADFMSANRMARKYLLTVATGMTGGSGMVATWQMYYEAGATPLWWEQIGVPVGLVVAVTGFIIYRFRETRALTLFQFFEMRYSRKFRIFAGIISYLSGIINYGIFPAVVAKLIMDLSGLPDYYFFDLWGSTIKLPVFSGIMIFNLTIAAFIACVGGQIAIMLTDFYQEVICKILIVLMTSCLIAKFFWSDIFAGLSTNIALVDPFNTHKIESFNIWYFLIGLYGGIYNAKSWAGNSGYSTSAKTPHDAQMAGVLGRWRHLATQATYIIPPIIAYAVLHNLDAYGDLAQKIIATGVDITKAEKVLPMFLSMTVPSFLFAGFSAMVFACSISIDDTSLHSWGGIFVQDVILPLCKKPLQPKTHMLLLRLSIIFIAVFAFFFSLFYPIDIMPIFMFYALTGAIYLGGAGIVIFGGLYWKRGTTLAAWVSMITGGFLAVAGNVIQICWEKTSLVSYLIKNFPQCSDYLAAHADKFPINGQWLYFIAMMAATLLYVVISLMFPKPPFNLDRMLHRGKYQLAEEEKVGASTEDKRTWLEKIGYSREFGKADSFLFFFTIGYCLFWWVCFLIGTAAFFLGKAFDFLIPLSVWYWYFGIYFGIQVIIMIAATIWLTIGGVINAAQLPGDMRSHISQVTDDGSVAETDN